jgi:hypothetical protein
MKYHVQSLQLLRQHRRLTYGRAVAIGLLVFSLAFARGNAWATVVPPGPHAFDGSLPGSAFVAFNGTSFVTPAVAPTATFGVSIDAGVLHQDYPLSSFHIGSGFAVTSAYVLDAGGTVNPGDPIFASIGPGSFDVTDSAGTILSGTFTSATFTSTVGATAGSLSASNVNGLVLTPGPAFTFDTSYVSSILALPTGFGISLSSIPGGVAAVASGPPVLPFIPASILPFALSSGSSTVSGVMTVVPEPSTATLLGLGALGAYVLARKRRR